MKKVLKDLKEAGSMTKEELISQRGGSGIKFTTYRRALVERPNVMDTNKIISNHKGDKESKTKR